MDCIKNVKVRKREGASYNEKRTCGKITGGKNEGMDINYERRKM